MATILGFFNKYNSIKEVESDIKFHEKNYHRKISNSEYSDRDKNMINVVYREHMYYLDMVCQMFIDNGIEIKEL